MSGESAEAETPRGDEPPRSVLATLREIRGIERGVLLPDAGSDDAPLVNTRSLGKLRAVEGRYQILGEIARGGVGIILKSRDVDLGRDVAMKVLRDEHVEDPDVVQRFVEEAQIGGQLQHPGMVQVYELGLQDDGRPFFSMKLVKGRTLGALLAERRDPSVDLRDFLKIFESVCQTVAYAHEHGVSHRDLKPSNVMIGAHEQVRVVDWGLAKVYGQGDERASRKRDEMAGQKTVISTVRSGAREGSSLSMVGSIIGTPAYMAPEQARGDNDLLDERSDVFALGAILCEILTGRPPYQGTDEERVDAAAGARLQGALERMESSGADPRLVELAKACMAPAREARPANAGVVADEIHSYLVSVEQREREARETEASAGVRVAAERKRRRLTVLTFAVVLATLLIGGGAFAWTSLERSSRWEAAGRVVDAALHRAVIERARATQTGDLDAWSAALSSARKAMTVAEGPDASEGLVERARALFEQIQVESDAATARERQAAHDRALATRLDTLRERAVADPFAPVPTDVTAALASYGIHLDETAAGSVPESARGTADGVRIARALTSWAHHAAGGGAERKLLTDVARAFDPDPWREALLAAGDADGLGALADRGTDGIHPADLVDLALALEAAGDPNRAGEILAESRAGHPSDFSTALAIGAFARRDALPPPETTGIDDGIAELARGFCAGITESPSWPASLMPWPESGLATTRVQIRRDFENHGRVTRVVPFRRVAETRAIYLARHESGQVTRLALGWHDDNPAAVEGWGTVQAGLGAVDLAGGGASPLGSSVALEHLEAAVALRLDSVTARVLRALSLLDLGAVRPAEAELAAVGSDARDRPDVLHARSLLAEAQSLHDDAVELARALQAAEPASPRALARLVDALLAAGDLVAAVEAARSAPEGLLAPERVATARRLAAIDLDLERFLSGARRPADADEAFAVARVLELRGHPARAEALYSENVRVTPLPGSHFWDGLYDRALRAAVAAMAASEGEERQRHALRAARWLGAITSGWRTLLLPSQGLDGDAHYLENPHHYVRAVTALRRLRDDAALAPLRDENVLASLPAAVRAEIGVGWDSAAAMLLEHDR